MKLLLQPDGISCGPTVIKMITDHKGHNFSIDFLILICGTNHIIGTDKNGMRAGLEAVNLRFEEPRLLNRQAAFEYLDRTISDGDVLVIRTLTRGIKHWILAIGKSHDSTYYRINDPWLGEVEYTPDELNPMWAVRNFDCFRVAITTVRSVSG